jgi:predicted Rossmann fold nucleotide-binding protein DprA/Smf involved in DNA uptake
VTSAAEIASELGIETAESREDDAATRSGEAGPGPGESGRRVSEALSLSEDRGIDELLATLDLPPGEVYSALLELELCGKVRRLPGERYVLRVG